MTVQFADNSAFLKAINLLVDLQHAICEDDEERADALRDALEIPLSKLRWEANEWLRGLSGDLDMLCDQEVFEPNNFSEADYHQRLLAACRNIETAPEDVLVLLRKKQQSISSDVIAYFRGRAYSMLGFNQLGTLFLRRAIELAPDHVRYKAVLLGTLWSNGDLEQANSLATAIFDDEGASPDATLLAASVMFQSVRSTSPVNRESLGLLRQKISRILRSASLAALAPDMAALGFMILGATLELLNRKSQAYENYSRACNLVPNDATPFFLRGRLILKDDGQKALADFRHAANLGISDPLPYLILAREALKTDNYEDCKLMCLAAIELGGPLVQEQAHKLMAVAESHAGNYLAVPALSATYQLDFQKINLEPQTDWLGSVLRAKSGWLWSEENLFSSPSTARLSIAA